MTDDVAARVRRLVGEMSPIGAREVSSDDRILDDLGYDSVAVVELALALEGEFGLDPIDDQEALGLETVGDVEALIARLTTVTDRQPVD